MNYLSGALRYVAGGETDSSDAVPRLIDRIKTSALPQDRRAAIAALTEATKLSPQRQVLVGEVTVKVIYAVLEQDKEYDDTLKATLELLIALCGTLDPPDTKDLLAVLGDVAQGLSDQAKLKMFEERSAHAAATNVDMFLGLPKSILLLLELLEKTDFYVKFSTIELLTAMAANSPQTLQMAVLEAPQGVTRICDLLDDNHRLLRSNAVLLLSTLCDESPEICKIVAYGGVLEKLFTLIEAVAGSSVDRVTAYGDDDDDDNLEAAIVVQDVLYVLRNLIQGASTTRTFFRDTGCLPRLVNVIKRATADANMLGEQTPASSGRKNAVEKQARNNLIIAMHCISGLAKDGDNESRLVKNDLATTNLFNLLAGLAFSPSANAPSGTGQLPERLLEVRIVALKTMAMLARGHDDFRSMFSSSTFSAGSDGDATSVQIGALHAMLHDPSSAIRVAAYSALRESFVVDAGLDLPSSNLLNAMTSSGGSAAYSVGDRTTGLRRNPVSSNDLPSPSSPVHFIAESLKASLVDWPGSTDAAGVFYAASLVTWVVDRVEGARERLLASYVSGSSLLPQVIRVLGKLEREKGPPEVRIALFSLACTWLHGSPSAVSAFLSSAMHLPMLVDVLNGTGSRGDVAEVHVRGLSAVLLGICLQATDSAQDATNDGGFLSGGGGPSMVIPRGTVADVIRNRIGVTVFTACLDDLRASKAFSAEKLGGDMWAFAEKLIAVESRTGFLSGAGNLGHEQWYSAEVINVVNDVYKNVGAKALDLIAEQPQVPLNVGNGVASSLTMNGHAGDAHPAAETQRALLADSARDEVLNSYKEFIRSQDESLNAARRQIEELATALRETQRELDSKANEASVAKESDIVRGVQKANANEELVVQKEALEALLEEKSSDFAALSDAYAALEEEHNIAGSAVSAEGNASVTAEISSLRSQNAHIRDSLNAELAKSIDLAHHAALLDSTVRAKDAELEALARERDSLKSNAHPEVAEALQWRTRAEVAEASLTSRQSVLDSVQVAKRSLEDRLRDVERSQYESAYSVSSLEKKLESAQLEVGDLRSTRRRELQVARESSQAATAAAQKEIAVLKQQLAESVRERSEAHSSESTGPAIEELKNFEGLKRDHQSLIAAFEQMKMELLDTKSAISQWQKRAEAAEAAREREVLENSRLSNVARDLETQVRKLNNDFASQAQASSARVLELEQQNAELDEMRRRAGEETNLLKEELATRTEQSIRLSGQLYETEESKMKVEEKLQGLQEQLSDTKTRLEQEKQDVSRGPRAEKQDKENPDSLQMKIVALEEELEVTKDALADSKDRESLSEAHSREREAAVAKAASLEQSLVQAQAAEAKLMADVDELKQRLLSLDEAEEAKRALTMQVVSLQKSLADVSPVNQGTPGSANAKLLESVDRVKQLQTLVAERDMRLNGLESSLTAALDRTDAVEKDKVDLEKQVAETEAMLSVLNSERDGLSAKCDELQSKLEAKPPLSDLDSSILRELEDKLGKSEEKRVAVSNELTSLMDACRQAEQESREIRNDCDIFREEVATCEQEIARCQKEFQELQKENDELRRSHEVERVVNSTVLEAAIQACSDVNSDTLKVIRHETDIALSLQSQQQSEIDFLKTEMDILQVALRDRDVSLAAASSQSAQLTQLSAKLAALGSAAAERDDLALSLEGANAAVRDLTKEKDALHNRLQEQRSIVTIEKADDPEAPTSPTHKRVVELEDALRDAARTVSGTNLELISAQALLVELSADKTAIRTELTAAQEQIQQLNARLSIEMRSHPNESALSEVSEQEHLLAEVPADPSNTHAGQELTEQSLKTAHAEVENLRTILKRSISAADSAVSLLTTIDVKVGQVERKLHDSQSSLDDSKAVEKKLEDEVEALKQSYESEKKTLSTEIDAVKVELSNLKLAREQESKGLTEKVKSLELSGKTERERLQSKILEKEYLIGNLKEESAGLKSLLQDASEKVERFSERTSVLEAANSKYASTILAMEGTVSTVHKALDESETREKELQGSLQTSREELQRKQDAFVAERQALEAKQKKEVEELEAELDRDSQSMEDAERKFRNAEASLKSTVAVLEDTVKSTRKEVESVEQKWKLVSTQLATVTTEKKDVEDALAATVREKETTISNLIKERDEALLLVERRTLERDATEKDLICTRGLLEKTKAELKEEGEQKVMLEGENQDFLSSIESLETASKRLRDELTKTENELASVIQILDDSDGTVRQQVEEMKQLSEQLKSVENEVKQLRVARAKLQDEADGLRVSLDSAEAARETAEQDNSDLKAWVGDLERQATDLQSAAENFEEVEQSLREALEVQRDVAEQNVDLAEELKKERELVASTEAQLRGAIRDRNAAESARESSERRTNDLEARIREIREEHLVKFSNSADAIKAKAQRCAELETKLASAERQLAELATVSDSLFGARAELSQRIEDIKNLRERAESAELRAEDLQTKVQTMESEMVEMRESATSDAYRTLDAEHNELLVCLADLELECTTLKEELGRE